MSNRGLGGVKYANDGSHPFEKIVMRLDSYQSKISASFHGWVKEKTRKMYKIVRHRAERSQARCQAEAGESI